MSGLYIHVPFCKTRCIYCGFYSTTMESMREKYVDALCSELQLRSSYIDGKVSTIYIGGGTPSQLSEMEIERIFNAIYKYFDVEAGGGFREPEITMECNPDDVDCRFGNFISQMPVNRISMGAQSFNDDMLRFVRRRHNAKQIPMAVDVLRRNGIDNISIDLMFGFPEQTEEMWLDDLKKAVALNVEHISAYSLMYEEGTPLYSMLTDGKVKECDEELSFAMYGDLVDTLKTAGYEHYEISNFAKPGYRSRHNSSYWHDVPYLGVGASAHSFNKQSRQWNVSDVMEYTEAIRHGEIPAEVETLSRDSRYDDIVMTSLRTCEGIDMNQIEAMFGTAYLNYLKREAGRHVDNGLLKYTDDGTRLMLTRKGIFVSDNVMADLMHV